MHEQDVWEFVEGRLADDEPVVLMVVVHTEDDTPGKPGFKMAVAADGALSGTVGGGALEHRLVERAREMLDAEDFAPVLTRHELPDYGAEEPLEMICGGTQTVALCPLAASDEATVEQILTCLQEGETVRLRLTPEGMSLVAGRPEGDRHTFTQQGERWQYEETLGYADTVYIVGGGHVGLALSRALAPLELRIVVIDERPEVDTLRRNRWAHEKCVVPFDSVAEEIPEGEGTYVIIATPQHSADECVLRQLVCKRLRYLGMLGSTTKVRQIMANMREDDFSEEELARVRSPVGLPIGSHTPAEIAISIAAEIIKVKNA